MIGLTSTATTSLKKAVARSVDELQDTVDSLMGDMSAPIAELLSREPFAKLSKLQTKVAAFEHMMTTLQVKLDGIEGSDVRTNRKAEIERIHSIISTKIEPMQQAVSMLQALQIFASGKEEARDPITRMSYADSVPADTGSKKAPTLKEKLKEEVDELGKLLAAAIASEDMTKASTVAAQLDRKEAELARWS